jgi:hypothetical protein
LTVADNFALSLDGNSAYVMIPSSDALQNPNALTVEAWIYPTPNPNNQFASFINKGDGASGNSARTYDARWLNDGTINFSLFFQSITGEPDYALLSTFMPSNQWSHLAATFDSASGQFQLFVNGALAAQVSSLNGSSLVGRTIRQTTLPLVLGWTPPYANVYATGFMDEIRVWSRALSAQEIQLKFSCRLSGSESGLEGYWNFDSGTANDLTGHNANGSLSGNASFVPIEGNDDVHAGCGRPVFTSVSVAADHLLHLTLQSLSYVDFQIESSTNLVNWTPLITLSNSTGTVQFTDPATPTFMQRFYRAVIP